MQDHPRGRGPCRAKRTFRYDAANRLTHDGTRAYTWSPADRLTARGEDSFSYDPLDRLTAATVAGTAHTYTYDGDGLLAHRSAPQAQALLWDPATSPPRLLQAGGDRIVHGLGPLYLAREDGTTLTLASDVPGQRPGRDSRLEGVAIAGHIGGTVLLLNACYQGAP